MASSSRMKGNIPAVEVGALRCFQPYAHFVDEMSELQVGRALTRADDPSTQDTFVGGMWSGIRRERSGDSPSSDLFFD